MDSHDVGAGRGGVAASGHLAAQTAGQPYAVLLPVVGAAFAPGRADVPLDATLGAGSIGAAHIKFSDSSFADDGPLARARAPGPLPRPSGPVPPLRPALLSTARCRATTVARALYEEVGFKTEVTANPSGESTVSQQRRWENVEWLMGALDRFEASQTNWAIALALVSSIAVLIGLGSAAQIAMIGGMARLRSAPELARADYIVSSNIVRTVQVCRQAVLDARRAVQWLHSQGYEHIGVVGTSLGSCLAMLTAAHEPDLGFAVALVRRAAESEHFAPGLD